MGESTSAIVVAATGSALVAPVGTALPADSAVALNAAFTNLGYINEEGAGFSDSKTKEPIPVWQSFRPVRYLVSGSETVVSFVLRQWDRWTVPLAFGGGSITSPGAGQYRYNPPAPEFIDERALILSWAADAYKFRLVAPRVQLTEGVETQLVRTAPADLGISLGILGAPGVSEWYLLTDHPAFGNLAS